MTKSGYEGLAEDFIEMVDAELGGFDVLFGIKIIWRSKELPTAATPDRLLTEVLEDWVRTTYPKFEAFRSRKVNFYYQFADEVPKVVEALKPLCDRAFVVLNVMLSMDRDHLFAPRDYVQVVGSRYYEEAPGVTFTRFLNDMERLKEVRSETYERNVPRIAEVFALNRVANIMPRQFHQGWGGKLQPGETIEARRRANDAETRQRFAAETGIHTLADLHARIDALPL